MSFNRFITEYRDGEDFWKENPELLAFDSFYRLYEGDATPNKRGSTQVVRAIYFVYDYYAIYAGLPRDKRIELTEREYLKEAGAFEKYSNRFQPLIDLYLDIQKDCPRRFVDSYQEFIESKRKFIDTQRANPKISIQDWVELDKMSLNLKKMLQDYKEMRDLVEEEEAADIQGGKQLSLLAKGELRRKDFLSQTNTETNGIAQESN